MTPAQIEILFWYNSRACDYEGELRQEYVDEQTTHFLAEGLLTQNLTMSPIFTMTPIGHYYVEHGICAVPLPEATFTIPNTKNGE